jgi:glycosyltransferase involved in cell wall biosynthesis
VQFHIALEEKQSGALAPKLVAAGAKLHYCPAPRQPLRSASALLSILADHGPFQAIHCHNHHAAGFALALAAQIGVKQRVAHGHADFRSRSKAAGRAMYEAGARSLLRMVANVRVAVSRGAARDLFGKDCGVRVLPCGFDWESFLNERDVPNDTGFKLVHVGRLVPEKNHEFLFRVFAALRKRLGAATLDLVGDGPLRAQLHVLAEQLGIAGAIRFHGNLANTAGILRGASAFAFPSRFEGLGLAAVEAQAAGIPVLLGAQLPEEIEVLPDLVHRVALNLPEEAWVDQLLKLRQTPRPTVEQRRDAFRQSPYAMEKNIQAWSAIYAG